MAMYFPTVSGFNLQGRRFQLPNDFAGKYNVALIAFQQWQQEEVNTWLPFLKNLGKTHGDLRYYELPTIWEMPRLRQFMLNMGMRMGIPDKATREKVITLYLNKSAFRARLDIPDEDTIQVLLVDDTGEVLWRAYGPYNEAKGSSLASSIEQLAVQQPAYAAMGR
jgi:hypothetical protein